MLPFITESWCARFCAHAALDILCLREFGSKYFKAYIKLVPQLYMLMNNTVEKINMYYEEYFFMFQMSYHRV